MLGLASQQLNRPLEQSHDAEIGLSISSTDMDRGVLPDSVRPVAADLLQATGSSSSPATRSQETDSDPAMIPSTRLCITSQTSSIGDRGVGSDRNQGKYVALCGNRTKAEIAQRLFNAPRSIRPAV